MSANMTGLRGKRRRRMRRKRAEGLSSVIVIENILRMNGEDWALMALK